MAEKATQSPQATDVTVGNVASQTPLGPPAGAAKSTYHRDRESQRTERRLKARGKATELLGIALRDGDYPKLALLAELVVKKLQIEHCGILRFASDRKVVIVRAKSRYRDPVRAHPNQKQTLPIPNDGVQRSVELVQLADQTTYLDLLRIEGTSDRIHVFIPSRHTLTPLGVLTVQSGASMRLTTDERALLDSLGDVIGAAIDSHELSTGDELSARTTSPNDGGRAQPDRPNQTHVE